MNPYFENNDDCNERSSIDRKRSKFQMFDSCCVFGLVSANTIPNRGLCKQQVSSSFLVLRIPVGNGPRYAHYGVQFAAIRQASIFNDKHMCAKSVQARDHMVCHTAILTMARGG